MKNNPCRTTLKSKVQRNTTAIRQRVLSNNPRSSVGTYTEILTYLRILSEIQSGTYALFVGRTHYGTAPLDIDRLLKLLRRLIAGNNSVFVIKHVLEIISQSDHIIDIGPENGISGGRVVAQGTPQQIAENENSLTGKYLKGFIKEKIQ